eukprot:6945662-Prymnesium_polylepis.2
MQSAVACTFAGLSMIAGTCPPPAAATRTSSRRASAKALRCARTDRSAASASSQSRRASRSADSLNDPLRTAQKRSGYNAPRAHVSWMYCARRRATLGWLRSIDRRTAASRLLVMRDACFMRDLCSACSTSLSASSRSFVYVAFGIGRVAPVWHRRTRNDATQVG